MTDTPITAYPLSWPPHVPRSCQRKSGQFKVSFSDARADLADELDRMGAREVVLSTNMELRLDGWPRANQSAPYDPGVALYFTLKGKKMCMPCDQFSKVRDNIRAIGLSLAALRGLDRWGGGHMVEAAFTGFQALPAPEQARHWTDVLGVPPHATPGEINRAWRDKIRAAGGAESPEAALINVARDRALAERAA